MSDRLVLEQAIEKGEEEQGSIEFKEELEKHIHLTDNKRRSLVAQLRHRVLSGDGEATYVVGVDDDGQITGLTQSDFDETIDVLSILAEEASAEISSAETWDVDGSDERVVGLVTVEQVGSVDIESNHIVVGTAGHVDHGKSTLVASLVTGSADDGEGGLRSYLDVKPHEIERGLSADLSYAVYGFNDGEPLRLRNPDRKQERSSIVDNSDRLVSFVDTVGHQPWLRTTIRGLVGQRLDYGMLMVAADDGPTKTTREHLGVLLAMELPTIIAITKTDLVSDERVEEVEEEVQRTLRDAECSPLPLSRYDVDRAVDEVSSQVVPIARTSAVERNGIDQLDELFARLPKVGQDEKGEFEMYVDRTYTVEGVGTVVSGTIKAGSVEQGDELLLGPTQDGSFLRTKARSIEIHYHSVDEARAGQLVSIAVRNISEEQVRRGMLLTDVTAPVEPVQEFEAEVMVLNHPTQVTSGYEPVVHLETICEVACIEPQNDGALLPGDKGAAKFRFKFNPYVVEEGQRFVFREGQSKGVGTVTRVLPDD